MRLSKTTKRRLFLVVSCLALLVGAAGTAYVVRKQRVRTEYAALRADGLAAARAADNATAVDRLGRYLKRHPEDVDVLVEYARVRPLVKAPDRQHLRDTMTVLRHLLALRPGMTEQRLALARLYVNYGYASEALVTADKLLEGAPDDAEILGMRATALARMRRLGEALPAAQAWAKQAPADVDAHLLVLQLLQATGRPRGEIVAAVNNLLWKLNDAASFAVVRSAAAAVTGSADEARPWVLAAAALSQNSSGPLGQAMSILGGLGDPTVARIRALTAPAAERSVQWRIVSMLSDVGLSQDSLRMLTQMARTTNDPAAVRALVRRSWELNRWADVLAHPVPADADSAADLELKGMVGIALARTGKSDQAKAIVNELAAATGDAVAQAWAEVLGQALSVRPADARKVVDTGLAALKDAPGDPYLQHFVGQGYARLGESELAVANYLRAAQMSRTWATPLISLAEAYLGLGRQEQALDAAATAFYQRSKEISAVMFAVTLNACIESGSRRSDDATLQNLLQAIEASPEGATFVLPERVASLGRGKKFDEARRLIRQALAAPTAPDDAVLNRLAAASRIYKLGLEKECYDAIEARGGASPSLALSRAVATYLGGDKDQALAQFKAARTKSGKGGEFDWQVASARLLDLTRDPAAGPAWVELGDGNPDNRAVQEAALSARAVRGNADFIDRTIDRVRRLSGGDGVQWRVARARRLLDGSKDAGHAATASGLLTEALRAAPEAVEARFLQAKAMERQGKPEAAVDEVMTIVKVNPSLHAASLYLAQLLQARGDFARAREHLERATQNGMQDQQSRRWAAQLLAQQGDPAQAIKLLEETGEFEDGSDLLLATLYRQQNNLAAAEEICRRLLKRPDLMRVALAVNVYGALGRHDEAQRVAGLVKTVSDEPGMEELLLAEHFASTGKIDKAIAASRRATELAPKNTTAWEALILTHLANRQPTEAWAALGSALRANPRDSKLTAVASERDRLETALGDDRQQKLALAYVRNPETPGLRQTLELATSQAKTPEDVAHQLGRLRQLADQYPMTLTLQVFAADAMVLAKRFDQALAIATRAVQTFPQSADAARIAAGVLMNAGRWSETLTFAKAWHDRTINNPLEADLVAATALVEMKQPAAAADYLKPHITQALASPDKMANLIALYAVSLHNSGKAEEAEKVLMPALTASEKVRAAWVSRASINLLPKDAAIWMARVREITGGGNSLEGDVQLAGASMAVGQKAQDAELLKAARELRAKLIARTDLPLEALAVLASQAEQDKDYATAEGLYRRALDIRSLPVLQNNLAMLLVHQNKDLGRAAELMNQAITSGHPLPNYYDTLAHVQAKQGRMDQVIPTLRKAVEIDPENKADWLTSLSHLLAENDRTGDAVKVLEEAEAAAKGAEGKLSPETKTKMEQLRQKLGGGGRKASAVTSVRSRNP